MIKKTTIAAVALLAFVAKAETCVPTNVVVAPLTDAHWTQNAPYNDYSPKGTTKFQNGWEAGCVAIAAAQELYYWQWPWRLGAVHETSHPVLDDSNLALRFDGNVPFDWADMQDAYGDSATLKQKHAAAHLVLACQSLVQMQFVSGGGLASKNLPGTMEWFEYAGSVTPRASDANLAALKADFESGSPVQTGINFKGYGGHEVVGLGYATGTNSVGAAKNLIWLNLGWGGGSDGWYDLAEATEGETIIKSVQLGFRPIKSVQIEPVAPVSGSDVTLKWHLPNCYANKISGFSVAKKMPSASTTTWTDDFSTGGKGRSSNTNEMRVANGGLMAWDGTASAIYTWDEALLLSSDSILTYDIGSSYMSGMEARFEARFGNGGWQKIGDILLNSGRTSYYDSNGAESTMTSGVVINLGQYAGKMAQFRVAVEYTTGGTFANYWASMKIDNLSISNVKTFETVATDSTIAASARSTTFSGLTTGETYAFTVTPVMSDNSAAVTQTATTTIGTPAAAPTINAVSMSPKGSNLVQEGFCADIAMGWNIIDVACSESVASLEAFISHQSVLPQSKIEVVDNGSGSFSINIDATEVAAKWANQKMILTLKATNATGESAYKDVELCLKASGVPENVPGGKVWTGENALDGEDYTAKWSGGLPSDGDKVTFLAADGEYGAMMNLNLSSATTLDYVYVTGEEQLTISGTSSETLTANILKNDIRVEINSSKFKVDKAIPSADILIDSGYSLDCEIDQSRSSWIKKATSGYPSALTDSSFWNGTVVFSGYSADWLNPSSYGNTSSKVRFNGVAGYLAHSNPTFNPTIEFVDDGATPAFDWNNGAGASTATFKRICGTGTFKTSGSSATSERIVINDIGGFAGSFNLASKVVTIGTTKGADATNGRLNFNSGYGATIAGGKTWTIGGGVYLAGNQTLTVNGALFDSGALSANGTGTVLALAPTATVTAASLSFANNTIRLAKTADASPTFSVTGAANLANATIEVALADGMSVGDSIALMSAGSFEGVDSATLEGLDGYSLEVSGGTLYATKDIPPTPATSLEESEGFVTSESQLAFKDATLAMLTSEALGGKFGGDWAGTADGADVVFNNFDRTSEAAGTITCQAQVADDGYVKGVLLTFTQSGGAVYVFMTGAKYIQGASLGDSIAGGSDASKDGEWKYAVSALSLKYLGPMPTAVWVAGEFGDDRSAHGGLEVSLNGNTTNALGQIVIGSSTTLGATIALPDGFNNATMLVKYEIPSGGAPTANSVPASMFVNFDMGGCAGSGLSDLVGYFWNTTKNPAVIAANYAFSSPAPAIPQEGYLLLSAPANSDKNDGNHFTAAYAGSSIANLSGGEAGSGSSGLRFTGSTNRVTSVGVGGPTVAGAVPWAGMVIKSVALFDEWVTPSDLANYRFPAQGAVRPVDSDRYAIEPVVSWVNDFKTTEKGDYTLSVSGTTAAKDDTFGGTLTIGDAAAVIDIPEPTRQYTMLIKYSVAPAQNAQKFFAGGSFTNGASKVDIGLHSTSSTSSALIAGYDNGSSVTTKALGSSITPSTTGGYMLIAHDAGSKLSVYAGETIEKLAGNSATIDYSFTSWYYTKLAVGGPSGILVSNKVGAWEGLVVEKIAIFNGYYTPADLVVVENPEDGDTLSIASGATWNFAAGETKTYANIGTLSSGGTIAITNAATLAEGAYKLAEWTTPQIMSSGYGRVGTLTAEGLPSGLTAELVYGVKAIYLRVYDAAAFAARPKFKIMPYGDSITEGFNLGDSKANYRVLLGQKLSMLGYNVEMVGCYNKIQSRSGTDSFFDAIDPSGAVATNIWQWHSAKHGATLGVTALTSWQRSALTENVDTICAQAGRPDAVLLLGGINDLSPNFDAPATVFANWTNVVTRLVTNLPDSKIVVTTTLHAGPGRTDSLNSNADGFNTLVKNYINDMPAGWVGHVEFVDLCDAVKSAETGVISSDNLHPDWLGDDQMAEGWLSVITNVYPSVNGTFPSATPLPAVAASELGAAAKSELNEYRTGFKLCCTVTPTANIDTANPYSATGDGATENFEKVAYFVEYVRADNNAHKWVWVDMDAFGDADLSSVGLPSANRQQVVTKLHVKSNHNGIEDVAANDDTVEGWIEFSPYDYTGAASGVTGAPLRHGAATGNYTMFDWDDTLSASGSMGSMQLFRKAPSTGRPAQVLFAYNNWRSSTSEAEFGIGNFAQHFWGGAQTLDYTYTKGLPQMNASAYSVKRIEIWTKTAEPENPDERDLTDDETQMEGTRPLTPPAPNTIDVLLVYDRIATEYVTNDLGMTLQEHGARGVATMNTFLIPTELDTNFWFRLVGVHNVEVSSTIQAAYGSAREGVNGWECVNAMRERVGADVVLTVVNAGGLGGLAYRCGPSGIRNGGEKNFAYASVAASYYNTFAWVHEVGHLTSLYHSTWEAQSTYSDGSYIGAGFGGKIAGDGTEFGSIMGGGYANSYAFSSINHLFHGSVYSISNSTNTAMLDSTGVLNELMPYVANYYATVVPEGVVVKAVPLDEAIVASGATMTLSCNDPDATIYYYNASLGETEANAVEYSNPVTIEAGNALLGMAQYCVFAKKNGVKVTAADAIIDYKVAGGVYVPDNPADILDTSGLSWSVGDGWTKTTEQSCKGGSAYVCTPGSAATYSLKTTITVDTGKTLVFHHIDNFAAGASFVVWVDDVPMWYKKGANSTDGKWVTDSVFLAQGSHTIEFAFTGNGSTLYLDYLSVDRYTTTTDFPVPYPWIEACFPGISGQPDGMYETMAKMPGANGHPYWESYVLGLEPTNALSKFIATIRMEGQKPIVEYSPTNEVLKAGGAIEYILQGKPALSNDWQNVEFDEPGATNRFFRVKVTW